MKFLKSLLGHISTRPLAWAQLSYQKFRLALAITGIAFANILIFTQLGLRALLFDGVTLLPESLKGDLFLLSAYAVNLEDSSFPRVYLYQAAAIDGVASASPLYIGYADWVNPSVFLEQEAGRTNGNSEAEPIEVGFPNQVRILAFNPAQPVLNLPEANQQRDRLHFPGSLLFDRLSQSQLGPVPELFNQHGSVTTLMDNRRVYVVGLFSLGSTMFDKGHVIMSDGSFVRWKGEESLKKVTVGVLTLEPDVEPQHVQQQIQASLSQNVKALNREELLALEQGFRAAFPEGKILNFGAIVGFIVGVVVVYQVLYTDVSERLSEYATLKAIGYSDNSLLSVVLQEAFILAILGFIPGFVASFGVYNLLTALTRIPLVMRLAVVLQVFGLTLLMCAISGALATNKLRSADPADVF